MKKFILTITTALIGLSLSAQNIISDFTGTLNGHCSSFEYQYSMSGSVPMSGNGSVKLQGDSFVMKGDGLEIFCDGKTRWTNDVVAEECYIEKVDGGSLDFEANPALLVAAVDKAFTLKKTSSATFNGKKVTEASLAPVKKKGNIGDVSLFLSADLKPVGATLKLGDGSTITITIRNFTLGDQLPTKEFTLDTKKLDKSYIITDLR